MILIAVGVYLYSVSSCCNCIMSNKGVFFSNLLCTYHKLSKQLEVGGQSHLHFAIYFYPKRLTEKSIECCFGFSNES